MKNEDFLKLEMEGVAKRGLTPAGGDGTPDFPRITLENMRRTLMVFDQMTDPVLRMIAANQLVIDAETLSAKVGYWVDWLRRAQVGG